MKSDSDEQLHQLLRWKRWEQPDAAFWERFDASLQEKRLRTLVREGWKSRLRRLLCGTVRPVFATVGLLCTVTLLFFAPRPVGALAEAREMEFLLLTQEGATEAVEKELFAEGDAGPYYVFQAISENGAAVLSAYHF